MAVLFASFQSVFPVASFGGRNAPDDGQVFFLDLLVAKEFVQSLGNFGIATGDYDAGSRGVEAVVEMQFTVFPGVGLGLLIVVGSKEGVVIDAGLVRVSQYASRFLNGEDAGGMFGQDSCIRMKRKGHVVESGEGRVESL